MKQAKILTHKELKRVLNVAATMRHGARSKLMIQLSHLAGLRVAEIAYLKIGDVMTPTGEIVDQLELKRSYTKGQKHRSIPVSTKLRKELVSYLAGLSSLSGSDCSLDPTALNMNAPLIASQRRRHFSPNSLCQLFREIYANAGIVGASSHSGRRWFVTTLACDKNVPISVVQRLVGHASLATTQVYVQVTPDHKRQAVETL